MATVDGRGGWLLWPNYTPSLGAAVAFCVIFGVLSVTHGILRIQKRAGFATPLIVGGFIETVAYGFRAYAHYHPEQVLPYSIDSLFALVAPNFFALTIYLYLARIIRFSAVPRLSILSPAWLTRVFAGADIISFIILFVGEAIYNAFQDVKGMKLGTDLIIAGLLVQLFNICVFVGFGVTFHVRYAKSVLAKEHPAEAKKVKRLLLLTYKLCVSVWGRNIFILTTTGMGPVGFMAKREWMGYAFDAAQMVVVMAFGFIWYFYDVQPYEFAGAEVAGVPTQLKGSSDIAPLTTYTSNPYASEAYRA